MSDVASNVYGVTLTGFVIKPLQQIVTELEQDAQAIWGSDVDLDADSPVGQDIGNRAAKLYQLWELGQTLYSAMSPDTAEGVSLDRNCAIVAVKREGSTPTQAVIALYGISGTVISVDHLVSQPATGISFANTAAVTIGLASLLQVQLAVVTVTSGHIYSFTVNGLLVQYTATGSDTAASIAAALITGITATLIANLTVVNNGSGAFTITATDGQTAFAIGSLDVLMTAGNLASPGTYDCTVDGPVPAPVGTITNISTPVAGLTAVTNLAAATLGTNAESDAALRIRRPEALFGGNATDDAIATALLNNVAGVSYAKTTSNRQNVADALGRPPHSFEVVVIGGLNQAVANQIWASMPSGIAPYGNVGPLTVIDASGNSQTVYFSRPVEQYVWLNLTVTPDASGSYPANGGVLIKNAVVAWAQGNLGVGVSVKLWALNYPVASVPGIDSVVIEAAVTSTPTPAPGSYGVLDVPITSEQVAVLAVSQILVNGS